MTRVVVIGTLAAAVVAAAAPDPPSLERPALGLPDIDIPDGSTFNRAEIVLGEQLFFDKALSRDGTIACATCHDPKHGFAQNGRRTSLGIGDKLGRRNTPTVLNTAFANDLFHDGRAESLEAQAWEPILAEDEMGNGAVEEVLQRLAEIGGYAAAFAGAYGRGDPTKLKVARALAAYQRSLVSGNSAFDRWYFGGEEGVISAAGERGYQLFAGLAQCWQCHPLAGGGAMFSDQAFHNTGVGFRGEKLGLPKDLGRFEISKIAYDRWLFKTPSLRNVALTAPYMHDGSFATLEEVVRFYNDGGSDSPNLSPMMGRLNLSDDDIKDLVEFLKSLTGEMPAGSHD